MERTTLTARLGWILAALGLVGLPIVAGSLGALLAVAWASLFLIDRWWARRTDDRGLRLAADGVLVAACLLGAFEGGWYLLPAAVVFTVGDFHGPPREIVPLPPGVPAEALAGLAAAVAGGLAVAWLAIGPAYSSLTASIPGGAEQAGTASFVAVNGARGIAVLAVIVAALAIVLVASSVHSATGGRAARAALAVAALTLGVLAVAGAASIGPLLLPAVALSGAAWLLGARRESELADEA